MSEPDRDYYQKLNRRARLIGARLEALACGYVTADAEAMGGEAAAHASLMEEIRGFAAAAERAPLPPSRSRHG